MIKYFKEADKDNAEIIWEVLGDETTEEVVVRALCGKKTYEKRKRSSILTPLMSERIFGIDQSDLCMSYEMSNELYEEILTEESK